MTPASMRTDMSIAARARKNEARYPIGALAALFMYENEGGYPETGDELREGQFRHAVTSDVLSDTPSQNLLGPGRRQFTNPVYWTTSNAVITDGAAADPDGNMQATTVVASSAASWRVSPVGVPIDLPADTYVLGLNVRWRGTGDPAFKIGIGPTPSALVATAQWVRYVTPPIVWPGGLATIAFNSGAAATIANFEICDFGLFRGEVDLVQPVSAHLMIGATHFASREAMWQWPGSEPPAYLPTLQGGGGAFLSFPTEQTLTEGTVSFVYNRSGAGLDSVVRPIVSVSNDPTQFVVPGTLGSAASIFTNGAADGAFALGALTHDEPGWIVMTHTWTATRQALWINKIKVLDRASDNDTVSFFDLDIGFKPGVDYGDVIYAYLGIWPRALTDKEISDLMWVLKSRLELTFAAVR